MVFLYRFMLFFYCFCIVLCCFSTVSVSLYGVFVLKLIHLQELVRVYVLYDARAYDQPQWLKNRFVDKREWNDERILHFKRGIVYFKRGMLF